MSNNSAQLKSNREIMRLAREGLDGMWGKAALVTLVYGLIAIPFQIIPIAGTIVALLITGPFMLGWALYGINVARNNAPQLGNLFYGFNEYGRALAAYFLILVYVILWSLLFVIPGIMALYAYSMTYFILVDNPDIEVNDAIRLSRQMMYGHRWKYFCLICRFIGWIIIASLTFGIGLLWLWPYIQTAFATFYDDVKTANANRTDGIIANNRLEATA